MTEEQIEKNRAKCRRYYWANRDKELARGAARRDPEAQRRRDAERYATNPEAVKAAAQRWRERNRGRARAKSREWQLKNPEAAAMHAAARRARERRATPPWADKFLMREVYDLAARRTAVTGIEWHVDHVVPMNGDTVSGLHCEANLDVIPAKANLKKQNHYWPDMP